MLRMQNGGLTTQHDTAKRRESFLIWPIFDRNFTFKWVLVSILISDVETPISINDNDVLEGMNYVFIHDNWFIAYFASQALKAVA